MTFVATAMSLGAYAQDATIDGYYRVINAGYKALRGTGVVYISEPTTAQPQKTADEAVTLPGTIMYINADAMKNHPEESLDKYMDIDESDLIVNNLRSQAVDASAAIYGPLVEQLRTGFLISLTRMNQNENWGIPETDLATIIEDMFYYMQMFMTPTTTSDGQEAWYLKSTTPNTQPLVDALTELGVKLDFQGQGPKEWAWNKLFEGAIAYYYSTGNEQLAAEFEYFEQRIHIGHTYYLIGGRVDTDLATYQEHNPGKVKCEFISFANNNQYYTLEGFQPEIEVAGDYSKWFIEEVVPGTETEGTDYFAVKGGVKGNDGHYYTTIYTDYPMEIVQNGENTVRAWGIQSAPVLGEFDTSNGVVGYVTTTEYTDVIPARTPVVVECLKTSRETNLLNPTLTPMAEEPHGESFLKGIFFEEFFDVNGTSATDEDMFTYYYMPLEEGTTVARKLIRVFNSGNNTENPLGFFKYTGSSIAPNKAFMILDSSMANANIFMVDNDTFEALGINEVNTVSNENATIYDIQGRVVTNPTKGLYIVNGKKMVIK